MRPGNLPSEGGKAKAVGSAAGISAATSVTALAVSACCVGPLAGLIGPSLVALLGATGAATAVRLAPYAPYLFGASFASIVFGFWSTYRLKETCAREIDPAAFRRARFSRALLWFAAAVFVVSLAYITISTGHFF